MSARGRVVASLGWIVCAALWASPRTANALAIQLSPPSYVSSATASGPLQVNLSSIPTTGSLPTAGLGVHAGNSAYTAYDLSGSAFLISFDLDAQSNLDATSGGLASSTSQITFSVGTDVPYSATGLFVFGNAVQGEDSASFQESLVDVTQGSVVFSESFSAVQALQQSGNPLGTLHAGRQYQFSYTASLGTGLNGALSLTGTGNAALYFAPEPSSLALVCCSVAALALSRHRRARP